MFIQGIKTDDGAESGIVFSSINNEGILVEFFEQQPEGTLISNQEEFASLKKGVTFVSTQELMQSLGRI